MSDELKATGDYYYGDMYRWQVRIEEDGRQWIHPETQSGVDGWVPTSHDWVLPRGVVLVRTDTLDILRAKWDTHSVEHSVEHALRAEVLRLNAQYYEMDTYGCPDCNGDGEIKGNTCFTCNGHGVLYTKPKETE